MKLIDLLVRELHKRGGWNENWMTITQDSDGYLCCWKYDDPKYNGFGWGHISGKGLSGYFRFDDDDGLSCDNAESIVTRDQYEAALAASQKVEWSGDGLPPVWCECEWQDKNTKQWEPVKVVYASEWVTVIREINKEKGDDLVEIAIENYGDDARLKFRPLSSEADKKRDDRATAIDGFICGFGKQKTGSNKELAYALTDYLALIDKLQ